jgi:hypothetical protein
MNLFEKPAWGAEPKTLPVSNLRENSREIGISSQLPKKIEGMCGILHQIRKNGIFVANISLRTSFHGNSSHSNPLALKGCQQFDPLCKFFGDRQKSS